MKHKEKNLKLQELIAHSKIDEQNWIQSNKKNSDYPSSIIDLVESKNGSKFDRRKGPRGKRPN